MDDSNLQNVGSRPRRNECAAVWRETDIRVQEFFELPLAWLGGQFHIFPYLVGGSSKTFKKMNMSEADERDGHLIRA